MLAISLHYVQAVDGPSANAGLGLAYTICNILLIPMGLGKGPYYLSFLKASINLLMYMLLRL